MVPIRKMLFPGEPELTRYMSVPHVEQKWFVMLLPEAMVSDWLKVFRFSRPRRCFRCVSAMMKLDANMDAVILWQSEQLQTKLSTRPGPSVGYGFRGGIRVEELGDLGRRRKGGRGA